MNCSRCGTFLNANTTFCPNCGMQHQSPPGGYANQGQASFQPPPPPPPNYYNQPPHQHYPPARTSGKPPILMAILSFLIVGLGQIILGQVAKGITMLVCAFIIGFITFGVGALILWVISAVDAYMIADKKQKGRYVGDWEFF
jgi:TM2 domain-containing membrane protein YozV